MRKEYETKLPNGNTLVFTRMYGENDEPLCNCGSGQPVATCQDDRGFCG